MVVNIIPWYNLTKTMLELSQFIVISRQLTQFICI
ncbi:hypothetical protein SHEWT2_01611 [Shewanella hafniensis]|uniref:Uncharacterized protein n=1 Tax=Shewanella putrefaciens (strain 200) TaxID=399804 RepID=E6XNW3_SHEP2|nr:hypothetical protein [Shewanella putrefaciens]CAD6367151.1 hypothetical protein SHEWT2_01611 [Shewanella hafniensis]